jgi:septum formation inhibitor-activating ATPase MinD
MKNAVVFTHPKSNAAKSYKLTTRRMLGENVKFEVHKKGFFRKFLGSLGIQSY